MNKPVLETVRPVKRIPRIEVDASNRFIESHELSLLSLLVAKHPERAREFLSRLKGSMKAA